MGHAAPGETVNTTYDMKKPEVLACLAANGNVSWTDDATGTENALACFRPYRISDYLRWGRKHTLYARPIPRISC